MALKSDASSSDLIVFLNNGLSTQDLANWLPSSTYLRTKIPGALQLYSDLAGGFDQTIFTQAYPNHATYNIKTIADGTTVAQSIKTQVQSVAQGTQTVSLIVVDQAVSYADFDTIAKTLINGEDQVSGSLVVAIAGNQGLALSQAKVAPRIALGSQPMSDDSYNQTIIAQYVYPNALNGILISLSMIFVLLVGFMCMMQVQTPVVFVNESIDWGKVEK